MRSDATTPEAYLAALPEDRRAVVERLRDTLNSRLPAGFEERMGYGMLAWVVPHALFPAGYHCDPSLPLPFLNIASQKNHVALYHMGLYDGPLLGWLHAEWPRRSQAKLDLGKCCLRFKKLELIPYDLIGDLVARMTPQDWIAAYTEGLAAPRERPNA